MSKSRVTVLVKALPGVDAVRAAHILGGLSIADAQRIGGLDTNQHRTLLELVAGSSTIAAAIPEFLEGLAPARDTNVPEDDSALLECLWVDEQNIREVHVVVRKRAITLERMEHIRAGRVYTGDHPPSTRLSTPPGCVR